MLNDDIVKVEIDKVYDRNRNFAPWGLTSDYLSFELSWQLDSTSEEPWAREVALRLARDYVAQAIEAGILVAPSGRYGGLWRAQDLPLRNLRRSEH